MYSGALADLVADGDVLILSGAGLSTDSGIPDYRGPDGLRRITPMTIAEFRGAPHNRRRYWARAHVGWNRFRAAGPNDGHRAVAALERAGLVRRVITQNVDGLHQAAGSQDVIDLHGCLDRVSCLACGTGARRRDVERAMAATNPGFSSTFEGEVRPDGDVGLADEDEVGFVVPRCGACGADQLKPDVVFFGESVPRATVDRCFASVEQARSLLVLGSSLQVMSGLRFVRHAARLGRPVGIVTRGPTRGDAFATVRVDDGLTPVLAALAARLIGSDAAYR